MDIRIVLAAYILASLALASYAGMLWWTDIHAEIAVIITTVTTTSSTLIGTQVASVKAVAQNI